MSVSKKRLFNEDYIKYGFTVLDKNGTQLPQCVVCHLVLSNDAMRPARLERHLTTNHVALKDKPKDYFVAKLNTFKRMKLDSTGVFHQDTTNVVEASYELALLIAKEKKAHTIGETLVKPCMLTAAKIVLGDESRQKLSKISLSDNTVRRRIDDLAANIKSQVIDKVKASPFFSIQCDETTDLAQCCQLIVYCRFVGSGSLQEEILFSKALKTTSKASDIMSAICEFFKDNGLSWERVVGICTDGAPAMLGSRSGFLKLAKEKNPAVIGTHCVIHRQALAAKTLPDKLNNSMKVAIQIVNSVKASALNTRLFQGLCADLGAEHKTLIFHTEVRWLSKGNMLGRLYELKSEVEIFLLSQNKNDLYDAFTSENNIFFLAYLSDFFEALNNLNIKLQGQSSNIMSSYDTIRAFMEKIQLWKRRLQARNFSSFTRLNELIDDKDINQHELSSIISLHLDCLVKEFKRYFPDFSDDWTWKLTRNPFNVDIDSVEESLQEEAIELKCDTKAKDEFQAMNLDEFWVRYLHIYPKIALKALRIIVPFCSTYLCESGFSTLALIKTKQRSLLEVESDLRCALSNIKPNISELVKAKRCQSSH